MVADMTERRLLCQKWLESEQGWGTRPDGYSLHMNDLDRETYVDEYWETMPKEVPQEYSRPDGTAYWCPVSEETYEKVKASKNGLRFFYEKAPWPYGPDGYVPYDSEAGRKARTEGLVE